MLTPSDILRLRCTPDLIEGGIACALHSLPYTHNRVGESIYVHLRQTVAGIAVELALRHYLSSQDIPFEVKGATPFSEPDRYNVVLGGRRCEVKSLLIAPDPQIADLQQNPEALLRAPALVPSDQHAGWEHSPLDFYLFAFLLGSVGVSPREVRRLMSEGHPYYLVHVIPASWSRPSTWNPLGRLVLKSDSAETQIVEIGGKDEGREMHSCRVELPPRARIEIPDGFFSISYIRSHSLMRVGIYSPVRKETYLIEETDWGNIWLYGGDILLAGYITRDELGRRARFVPAGSRVFQNHQLKVKNLSVPVSELRPLAELFERARRHAPVAAR